MNPSVSSNSAFGAASQDFPLSYAQERLWFLEQMGPRNSAYNVPEAWRLRGVLNLEALKQGFRDLVQWHETLRTAIVPTERGAAQRIFKSVSFSLVTEDCREEDVDAVLAEKAQKLFELGHAPLFRAELLRLGPEDHVLLVTFHHIICDDWSTGVFCADLAKCYLARCANESPELPPLEIQYADFASWQKGLASEALAASREYWKTNLAGEIPMLEMPFDKARGAKPSVKGRTVELVLSRDAHTQLKELCRAKGVTLYGGLLAAFCALVARYTRQQDFCVGGVFSGREQMELEPLIGFFVNTHAIRTDTSGNATFAELMARVQRAAVGAASHQSAPFEEIVREVCPNRTVNANPLFQMLFGLQPGAGERWTLPGLATERLLVPSGGAKFDLALLATESERGIRLTCEYNSDLYHEATVRRFLRHYANIVAAGVAQPESRIEDLRYMESEEEQLVLREWNDTGSAGRQACLHELFEEQAARSPDAIAIVDGERCLSYRQLNGMANCIAAELQRRGVRADQPVGICLDRRAELIATLLGVLKAGGAYLPLDPAYPRDRLAYMLDDAGAQLVLVNKSSAEVAKAMSTAATIVAVEDIVSHSAGPLVETSQVRPANLSHIIYTSGSTGRPKGVALEHRNAVALVEWARTIFTTEEVKGVLASTSVCFDLSVFEIFVPLSMGGTVILAENAITLGTLPAREKVTLVNTVPSAIAELLRLRAIPQSVRVLNLAGEPLTTELADRIYAETSVAKVYDLYGPTETTTYSTFALRSKGGPATIGRPLAGERAYVLDGNLQPMPPGIAGELYLGGAGVARGYHNKPELTQARFLKDPFVPGERIYKTGDLAQWNTDGTLKFLGRIDKQVKLRGFRIEPGEIESVLRTECGAEDAVVVVREDRPGDQRLVAYVIPCAPGAFNEEQSRQKLGSKVPQFMIPGSFVELTSLPLTANGKIDKTALPKPTASVSATPSLTATPSENLVRDIWRELLGLQTVGTQDNFFALGGHSLLGTQVISRVALAMGVELPLSAIFENPTVASLAAAAEKAPKRGDDSLIPRRAPKSRGAAGPPRFDSVGNSESRSVLFTSELNVLP